MILVPLAFGRAPMAAFGNFDQSSKSAFTFSDFLKFMFSKKATKIDEIFTADLTVTIYCQINGEDFVNFCGLLRNRELYFFVPKIEICIKYFLKKNFQKQPLWARQNLKFLQLFCSNLDSSDAGR